MAKNYERAKQNEHAARKKRDDVGHGNEEDRQKGMLGERAGRRRWISAMKFSESLVRDIFGQLVARSNGLPLAD